MVSEVGLYYVVFEIMEMFLKTFSEGSFSLANIFHVAAGAFKTIYAALLVMLIGGYLWGFRR